ncbi:MAG: flagellar biosynthesis repressor FlbT [Xanthobacteraceae bacterium]
MALKIELKPNERVLLGDCVITNAGQRTRLSIEGKIPILREKDIMSLGSADSLAKLIYLAVQFIYTARQPQDHHALYVRLADEFVKRAPSAKPYIDSINKRILTGEPYKALKEARKLIAYEKEHLDMHYASNAYAKAAAGGSRFVARQAARPSGRAPVQSQALDGISRRGDERR